MSNTSKAKKPKPVRVPPHAAAGLDDEITAQPRLPADELGSSSYGEAGLSLEPEDMGTRWLSEATEQGEAVIDEAPSPSEEELTPNQPREQTLTDTAIHEFSLLDEVNEAGDDTIAPDIQTEEGGRHARTTPSHARDSAGATPHESKPSDKAR